MATARIADFGNDGPPCACGNARNYRLVLYREGWRGKCQECGRTDLRLGDTARLRIFLDEAATPGAKFVEGMILDAEEQREGRVIFAAERDALAEARAGKARAAQAGRAAMLGLLQRAFGVGEETSP